MKYSNVGWHLGGSISALSMGIIFALRFWLLFPVPFVGFIWLIWTLGEGLEND